MQDNINSNNQNPYGRAQAYPINYRYANNQGSSLLAINNFGHPNRKHFPQYPTEIQRQQSLEFPSERGAPNFDQPFYPRNLNVRDIEGASPGTLPSPIIRNKENARKAIERDEQERRAQLGEQGRLYQEYEDSIDKFRHNFNAGNGGEFKDRHQLQNQDNPYAPIDNPRYAGDKNTKGGNARQDQSDDILGDNGFNNKPTSLLKPFKVPVEGHSNEREDQVTKKGDNQRQTQETQQQPLTDRRSNDQIKVATSNNFQPKERQATASLGNLDSFRQNQYTSNNNNNNNNSISQPSQYNSIENLGNNQNNPTYQPSYGTRINPTSMSYAGEIIRNGNGNNNILGMRHSIIGNQMQNILPQQDKYQQPQPLGIVNGTDPQRNTKTMLNLQKFDKYPGEFHGLGAGQLNSNGTNQGSIDKNIFAKQYQRAHAPEDQVGMALKNPIHSYQQGERNLDHYKRDLKLMNPSQPQPRDIPYKAYSQHQRQGDNLPLGAPFSYNPGMGKNKSTVMLNHQRQLEKLENSFEIAEKTYDNKLKTSPNVSSNKGIEQQQQQSQFQDSQQGSLRQSQLQQAQKQQQYQEQPKESAQQQQSQQQYQNEQQQQQQYGQQKEQSPFIPRNGYQQQPQSQSYQPPSYQPSRQNDGLLFSQQQYQQQQLQQSLDVYQKLQQQRKNQGRGGETKDGLPEYPQDIPTAGLVNRYDEGKKGGRQLMSSLGGVPNIESQLPVLGSKALKNISSFRIC